MVCTLQHTYEIISCPGANIIDWERVNATTTARTELAQLVFESADTYDVWDAQRISDDIYQVAGFLKCVCGWGQKGLAELSTS